MMVVPSKSTQVKHTTVIIDQRNNKGRKFKSRYEWNLPNHMNNMLEMKIQGTYWNEQLKS